MILNTRRALSLPCEAVLAATLNWHSSAPPLSFSTNHQLHRMVTLTDGIPIGKGLIGILPLTLSLSLSTSSFCHCFIFVPVFVFVFVRGNQRNLKSYMCVGRTEKKCLSKFTQFLVVLVNETKGSGWMNNFSETRNARTRGPPPKYQLCPPPKNQPCPPPKWSSMKYYAKPSLTPMSANMKTRLLQKAKLLICTLGEY